MNGEGREKTERVLEIYTKLLNGSLVNKTEEATKYHTSERSIQRDIDDIRSYLEETDANGGVINTVVYDRSRKGYCLERIYDVKLTNPEILAICKILLDSRALRKDEMESLIKKLIECCVPEDNRKIVNNLIINEKFHYIQPKHGKAFLQTMWDIGTAIEEQRLVEFAYQGVRGSKFHRRVVEPAAIMNAGMYFYMAGFIKNIDELNNLGAMDDLNPTIYRIDRMEDLKITKEHFKKEAHLHAFFRRNQPPAL